MYTCSHSPLGGGSHGSAHGEGVTGEDHTREAGHGVSYQGAYPQRALIGAGGGALQRGSIVRLVAGLCSIAAAQSPTFFVRPTFFHYAQSESNSPISVGISSLEASRLRPMHRGAEASHGETALAVCWEATFAG